MADAPHATSQRASSTLYAPAGAWYNGTQLRYAASLLPLHTDLYAALHKRRELVAAGGCCCDVCTSYCASSTLYSCEHCTGAATPACAACYYHALHHQAT